MKNWIPYIIIALLIGIIIFSYYHPKEKIINIRTIDTVLITQVKSDTIWKDRIKYRDRWKTDTLYYNNPNDSSKIDSTQIYHYTDSIININLQAKKLDWLQYNIYKKDTVKLIEHSIKYEYNDGIRKPIFYYGIGVGVGYGLINKKADVYVGFNVGLNF